MIIRLRKFKPFIIFCFICFLHACTYAQKENRSIIAFYNAENFFNPANNPSTFDDDFTPEGANKYTYDVFKQKTNNIAKVLHAIGSNENIDGASIIGLCEIEDDHVLKTLINHPLLKDRKYNFIRFDGADKRGINVALLYQKSKFKLLQSRSIYVDLKPAGGGYTRYSISRRRIITE
jgi:predicted extracellular nuclease